MRTQENSPATFEPCPSPLRRSYHTNIGITGSGWRCFPMRENAGRSPGATPGILPVGLQWPGPSTPI